MTSGTTPDPTGTPSTSNTPPPPSGATVHASTAGSSTAAGAATGIPSMEAMSALLAQNWWALALRGVFAILFGLIALFAPGATLLSLVLFFSAYMLIDGVFEIIAGVRAARHHERWGLLIAEGVLNILVGIIAFAWPGLTVEVFVILLAAWSIATGVLELMAAYKLKLDHGRGWMIFSGIVSILFGIALAIAPLIGALVLAWWLGVYALAVGIAMLVLAFRLKSRKDEGTGAAARV